MTDTPATPAAAEPPAKLAAALMKVLRDVEYVRPVDGGGDLDDVYRVLRAAFTRHGIEFLPSATGTIVDGTTNLALVQCHFTLLHVATGESLTADWPGGSADITESGQVTKALSGAVASWLKTKFMLRQGAGPAAAPPAELRRQVPSNDRTATDAQRNLIRSRQKQRRISDYALVWIIADTEGTDLPHDDMSLDTAAREAESRLQLLHQRDVDGVLRAIAAIKPPRRRHGAPNAA